MKSKCVSTIYAVIAGVIAVNFLLVPAPWIRVNDGTADAQGLLLFQLIVFLFAGLAMVSWTGRTGKTPALGGGLRHALIAANGLAAAVALFGTVHGVYKQFDWGPVAMISMAALGFAFVRPTGPTLKQRTAGSPVVPSPPRLSRETVRD